jgi:hypothetical protein
MNNKDASRPRVAGPANQDGGGKRPDPAILALVRALARQAAREDDEAERAPGDIHQRAAKLAAR